MKKCFLFHLKAFFVLKIFKFLSWHLNFWFVLVMQRKRLDEKDKVSFKIYGVTTCLTNNYKKHILPNISRSKGNQITNFGQVIEYNERNIFLEKLHRKWAGRKVPGLFLFYEKALYVVKTSGLQLSFYIFR